MSDIRDEGRPRSAPLTEAGRRLVFLAGNDPAKKAQMLRSVVAVEDEMMAHPTTRFVAGSHQADEWCDCRPPVHARMLDAQGEALLRACEAKGITSPFDLDIALVDAARAALGEAVSPQGYEVRVMWDDPAIRRAYTEAGPPKRYMPDGTPCWCVSESEPHEGWLHAPACSATALSRLAALGESVSPPACGHRRSDDTPWVCVRATGHRGLHRYERDPFGESVSPPPGAYAWDTASNEWTNDPERIAAIALGESVSPEPEKPKERA
jgi:hypothetical protein